MNTEPKTPISKALIDETEETSTTESFLARNPLLHEPAEVEGHRRLSHHGSVPIDDIDTSAGDDLVNEAPEVEGHYKRM